MGLVKLLLNPPNLLLMDEPTTHLDMASIDALLVGVETNTRAPSSSSATTCISSVALAQKVLHIDAGKLTPYAGGYDYYLEKSRATDERAALDAGNAPVASAEAAHTPVVAVSDLTAPASTRKTKEQKRAEAELRSAQSRASAARTRGARARLGTPDQRTRNAAEKSSPPNWRTRPSMTSSPGRPMQLNRELTRVTDQLERPHPRMGSRLPSKVQDEPPVRGVE